MFASRYRILKAIIAITASSPSASIEEIESRFGKNQRGRIENNLRILHGYGLIDYVQDRSMGYHIITVSRAGECFFAQRKERRLRWALGALGSVLTALFGAFLSRPFWNLLSRLDWEWVHELIKPIP